MAKFQSIAARRGLGGRAVGLLALTLTGLALAALPVAAQPDGTRIGMTGDQPAVIAPGETLTLPLTFLMVHPGDHFRPLDAYRRLMAERGLVSRIEPTAHTVPHGDR